MSSPLFHPRQQKGELDWARLIPGESPAFRPTGKKRVQSVKLLGSIAVREMPAQTRGAVERTLALLLPSPLRSRMAARLLRAVAADSALVALNWLLLGALLVPLHRAFPQVLLFGYAAGRPFSLLGSGALHAALITLMAHIEGLYTGAGGLRRQAWMVCRSVVWASAVLFVAYGLQGASWTIAPLICAAGALHCVALLAWRWQNARQCVDDRSDLRHVLIVGASGAGRRVAAYLKQHPESGRAVYGILDNEKAVGNGVIGRVSDLARLARTGFIDEVILVSPRDRSLTLEVLRVARRLRLDVDLIPELFGCDPAGREMERVGELPLICLHAEPLPAAGLVLKRAIDIAGAVLALIFLSPVLALIAGFVWLESPGGIVYRAQRVGRKGRLFRCYKFRTMVSNADELKERLRQSNQRSGPCFKIAADPRVTRAGRFLRRYSLDELPQLWNVLKGDMSLVGPRPHPVDDFAAYEIEHLARLDMTPGITGLWQVTARRDPSFERGMELDREYIRTWSLTTDVRILLKTVLAVAQGSGD